MSDFNKDNEEKPARKPRARKPKADLKKLEPQTVYVDGEDIVLPVEMPVMPIKDVAVFNNMIMPLYIVRERSVSIIEASSTTNGYMMLCAQRDSELEEPDLEDLYEVGSIVQVLRLLKMPDGKVKALVQGIARAKVRTSKLTEFGIMAEVDVLHDEIIDISANECEALLRTAREECEKILSLRGMPIAEIMTIIASVDEPGKLADLIAANLRLKITQSQELLECLDPVKRLLLVVRHLAKETEVASMQVKIQHTAREGMDKAQREYFLREQLKAIRKELGDTSEADDEIEEIRQALEKAGLPPEAKKEADKQLKRLQSMHSDSAEASVVRTYLDWMAELPWKKATRERYDIPNAKKILDEDHCGLEKIKDRILEYLSVRKLNPDTKGSIICFSGPPGVGKTSLGRSVARALGRKFQRISLGGMRDEAEIRGHRRTYIGSMPGRIIQAIKQAETRNPVIVLDEIDKLGSDFRGDPSSSLLEVLDPEQNKNFSDHYLNVSFDLSKVLFICTANHLENIPGPLRDRLEIIGLHGYTLQEKLDIAKNHLVERQLKENGLKDKDISFTDSALELVIKEYTRESGVRNLEREIGAICRKCARQKAEGKKDAFKITDAQVRKLLGAARFLREETEKTLNPGVAIGLAWTSTGGEVLHVEASIMKGKGNLNLTGQLGDVMKESAQAALSFARTNAEKIGLDIDFLEKKDIHIHVPAGATPKDGPSAGVTMVTALVSAISNKSVRADTCMTGEISLRGRVLPVGGIKEKILAGVAHGLKHALIPKQNSKDLEDVPADLLKKIKVHLVENLDEVLDFVIEK